PAEVDGLGASGFGNYTTLRNDAQLWVPSSAQTFDESITFETTGGEVLGANVTFTGTMSFLSSQMRIVGGPMVFNGLLNGDTLLVVGHAAFPDLPYNITATVWDFVSILGSPRVAVGSVGACQATPLRNDGPLDLNGVDTVIGPLPGCGEMRLGAATLTMTGK